MKKNKTLQNPNGESRLSQLSPQSKLSLEDLEVISAGNMASEPGDKPPDPPPGSTPPNG